MKPTLDVDDLIHLLKLKPLTLEGGLYRETYRSADCSAQGDKPAGSAIFYLLTAERDSFSALHRLPTDEIWHFYLGDPLQMTLLHPDGTATQVVLGQDLLAGQAVQFVVPRGVWQGTRLVDGGRWALVGTTMAPGYVTSDYEGGLREALQAQYPQAREEIGRLTRA
jgi:predicted cupin superfamily sugar epimerase